MAQSVGELRFVDDELTLRLLRRLASGLVAPSEVASELFAAAAERDSGPVTTEALHIAAEATTDEDLELARRLWLQLLYRVNPEPITGSAASTVESCWNTVERSTITAAITIPAAAVP